MNDTETTLKLKSLDLSQEAYEARYPVLQAWSYERWARNHSECWEMAKATLARWSGQEILGSILEEEE